MLSNDVRSGAIKLTDPQNLPQYYHNKRQSFACQFFIVVSSWYYSNFWRFGVRPKLGDYVFPNSIQLEFTQRPLLSGPPQFLLLLAMSRSGPPDAPLIGPADFDPMVGLGRGQVLPGAGGYGQQANVRGILPPG